MFRSVFGEFPYFHKSKQASKHNVLNVNSLLDLTYSAFYGITLLFHVEIRKDIAGTKFPVEEYLLRNASPIFYIESK
jgi:hypothetical protein